MNEIDFLDGYEHIANGRATDAEVSAMFSSLQQLTKGTDAEIRFEFDNVDRIDKVIAIDSVAHDFHSHNTSLLKQIFPNADATIVKYRLDKLAGLELEDEVRKYNRSFFTTLFSEDGVLDLTKQVGKTSTKDITNEIKSYENLYNSQMGESNGNIMLSDGELYTLWRFSKDQKYKDLIDSRGVDEPVIVGGYASVEVVDREGHLITTKALEGAFDRFMKSFRTRNIMIAHCLTPETLIRTGKSKFTAISDISIGDKVFSGNKRKQRVSNVIKRRYDSDINKIVLSNDAIINITDEHPVLTKRGWIAAKNLTCEDTLLKIENVHGFCAPEKHNSKQRKGKTWEEVYGHSRPQYKNTSGSNNPNYKERVVLECKKCSNKFEVVPHESWRKFCSNECWKSWYKTPENNPWWKGGISFDLNYQGFTKELKSDIFYRDGFTCQICGKKLFDDPHNSHIHHIDYDPVNSADSNLIALCCSCHSKTNWNREYWAEQLTENLLKRNVIPIENGTEIKSIERVSYNGYVYNLEVENDHTYSGNGLIFHNSDVQVGWPLPAWINKDGEVFKSGVDDKGLYLITEVRPDTKIAEKVRKGIEDGEFKSYSIAGTATNKEVISKGSRTFLQVNELELAEVTICEKPVNQESHFKMLKSLDVEYKTQNEYEGSIEEYKSDEHLVDINKVISKSVGLQSAKKVGDSLGIDWNTYDLNEFTMGMNVEMEHKDVTDGNLEETGKIALAHLKEVPDYYSKLKQYVEKQFTDEERRRRHKAKFGTDELPPRGTGLMKDIEDKVIQFFTENPSPDDDDIHNFAEELGITPDELEKIIYSILSDELDKSYHLEKESSADDSKKKQKLQILNADTRRRLEKLVSKKLKQNTILSLREVPEHKRDAALAGGRFISMSEDDSALKKFQDYQKKAWPAIARVAATIAADELLDDDDISASDKSDADKNKKKIESILEKGGKHSMKSLDALNAFVNKGGRGSGRRSDVPSPMQPKPDWRERTMEDWQKIWGKHPALNKSALDSLMDFVEKQNRTPPRPGLVWSEQSHRWVHPTNMEQHDVKVPSHKTNMRVENYGGKPRVMHDISSRFKAVTRPEGKNNIRSFVLDTKTGKRIGEQTTSGRDHMNPLHHQSEAWNAVHRFMGAKVSKSGDDELEKTIEKRGNKYALVSRSTGKTLGTHDTRREAMAQEAAIQMHKDLDEAMKMIKAVKEPFAVATAVAQTMGYDDFSEGSAGRKKRDEIAEALKETKSLDELKAWLDKGGDYLGAFKDKMNELKQKDGDTKSEHFAEARRHAAKEA